MPTTVLLYRTPNQKAITHKSKVFSALPKKSSKVYSNTQQFFQCIKNFIRKLVHNWTSNLNFYWFNSKFTHFDSDLTPIWLILTHFDSDVTIFWLRFNSYWIRFDCNLTQIWLRFDSFWIRFDSFLIERDLKGFKYMTVTLVFGDFPRLSETFWDFSRLFQIRMWSKLNWKR